MADKRIQIGVGDLNLSVLRAKKVTISEELESKKEPTFDEVVTLPPAESGFTIDIDVLEARSLTDFITLKRILKKLKTEQGTLSMFETVRHKEGNFESENHFSGVTIASNKVEYAPDSLTARSLSFSAETMREIVNNEEI